MNFLRYPAATLLAGALIGALGALFIKALQLVSHAHVFAVATAQAFAIPGWIAGPAAGVVGAGAAAWLALRYDANAPQRPGAEIPEGAGDTPEGWRVLAVNFFGTSLATGAGLALGPERPAIQMGGAIGHYFGRLFNLKQTDRELLVAAAGGAGVATMFNSPLGCAAYTVEAVLKRVDLRISMTALGAGGIAVAVMRALTGRNVNFVVAQVSTIHFDNLFLYLGLGGLIAVFASLHAHVIVQVGKLAHAIQLPGALRAGVIGGLIGLLAWYAPNFVGSGDPMIQEVLDGKVTLSVMAVCFSVRFFLGPLSLAAGTPGGYFTPVLLLGALLGSMYGILVDAWFPDIAISPVALILVGMAVALASIAHAPFTGILLVMEVTGASSMTLPMIMGVIGAVVVTRLMRSPYLRHGLEALLVVIGRRRSVFE